jgi:hypothetical protein
MRSRAAVESATVAEHKRRLEALFGGPSQSSTTTTASSSEKVGMTSMPSRSAPTERVFSSPRKSTGRAPSEFRLRLERLRASREPGEIKEAADAFLAHHQLPDDADILYKLLQHPSEKVVREALGQLSSLLMQGRIAGVLLLFEHLNTLAARVQEPATRSFIDGIRAQISKIRQG